MNHCFSLLSIYINRIIEIKYSNQKAKRLLKFIAVLSYIKQRFNSLLEIKPPTFIHHFMFSKRDKEIRKSSKNVNQGEDNEINTKKTKTSSHEKLENPKKPSLKRFINGKDFLLKCFYKFFTSRGVSIPHFQSPLMLI